MKSNKILLKFLRECYKSWLTICCLCIICNLVVSHLCFERSILVLIASVPGHCLLLSHMHLNLHKLT